MSQSAPHANLEQRLVPGFSWGAATLPLFDGVQHRVAFLSAAPNGFFLIEPNLVCAFASAIFIAAEMRNVGDPHDAVKRYVLVVNGAENRIHRVV